jgi:hypothetical protein
MHHGASLMQAYNAIGSVYMSRLYGHCPSASAGTRRFVLQGAEMEPEGTFSPRFAFCGGSRT